jgi:pyruvate dehydrogenase (quinone)
MSRIPCPGPSARAYSEPMVTVAENLIQTLVLNGVRRVYGLPGDSLNAVTEAIRTEESLEGVHVRHEETAPRPR